MTVMKTRFVPMLALMLVLNAQAGERFDVSIAGKSAGFMELTWSDDHTLDVHFEFNDRGRGPNINSHMTFDAANVLTSLSNTGNDYFKGPVDESLRIEDGRAKWSSKAEEGEVATVDPAYFVSAYGSPVESGLLARALLAAEDRTLDLLPAGRASIEFVGEKKISAGDKEKSIHLYQISGMDFEPGSVWLNPDGSFFGLASGWVAVLPEGFEHVRDELIAIQREADGEHQTKMAQELGQPIDPALAFKSARLFDAETGAVFDNQTVLIRGNLIESMGPDGAIQIPDDARVIDATGKLLMPGLWDMHTHLSAIDGPLNIAAGVTTGRDLANEMESLLDLEKRFNERKAIGPRVIRAGFMDGSGPYAGPTKALVDTEEDVLKWMNTYADNGYVQIKIYSSINTELVPFIVAETKKRGMRMSGHIPANMWAEDAVRAGYDEIQHINMFFLNFYKDVTDTRTPARFIEVARRGGELDLESEEVRAFVQLLKDEGIVYDPTVAVFQHILTARPGEPSPGTVAFIHRLPPQVQRQYTQGGFPPPEDQWELADAAFEKMLDVIKHLHEQGIPLVAGTDGLAGFTLHHEMVLYSRTGIPNADVLRMATLESARIMGMDAELGSIAPGKLADVILIDGDPLQDMSDLARIELVIKDGVAYESKAVYAAIGVH